MNTKNDNSLQLLKWFFAIAFLTSTIIASCSSSDPDPQPKVAQPGEVQGTVTDENNNPYPSTSISLSKGSEENTKKTNSEGAFILTTKDIGAYDVEMALPLSMDAVTGNPIAVNVQANKTATANFKIKPIPAKAHVNFDEVQILEEIVDKDGNTPIAANEPLYAKNNFDAPLGLLTAIKAPDGHHVTLAEFKTAKGNLIVHCNGNSSTVQISLQDLIPNGTYTFWLAYLKKKKKVGESIDFANDFVNFNNPPIGPTNGSGNVVVADVSGNIETMLTHSSCILSDEVALVIPILYHINGKTFGGGHQPDAEEMVHMLVYFQ